MTRNFDACIYIKLQFDTNKDHTIYPNTIATCIRIARQDQYDHIIF